MHRHERRILRQIEIRLRVMVRLLLSKSNHQNQVKFQAEVPLLSFKCHRKTFITIPIDTMSIDLAYFRFVICLKLLEILAKRCIC